MLNLSFHKDRDVYSDGDVEQDILAYIEQGGEQDWERVLEADSRWPVFYHLHPARKNILNWYPFKEGAQVLEVGAGMGAVTGALCEKAAHVTAVELSLRRAEAIDKRCGGRDNLEVMVANFNDIVFDRQFDCITLVGVLEYASLYTRSENPFLDFLTKLKALLKPGGKLLIAIENKFGMKYFAGAPEDHTGRLYDGLGGYVQSGSGVRTFGHGEIQRLLDSAGFPKLKFYYPLPDYKFPNVIFTDAFLPDTESIQRNLFYYL
ncbi:MAG: class I SAM-dependent methyltransferase, partial [Oscillospiraceae bacterium]|nr:class I SAM-dependent methyltransferase [Oscillospiraceae bacterium]